MELATKSDIDLLKTELLEEIRKIKGGQHNTPSKFLKSQEVCKTFQISSTKLYELRRSGQIPCIKIGGSYLYQYDVLVNTFKHK